MSRDPVEQIAQHIDKTDDPILVILRAHLLVEERLCDILAQISRAPEELKAARLSFHQALCLCSAVIGRHDDPAWDFIARLNEVRKTDLSINTYSYGAFSEAQRPSSGFTIGIG